MVSRSGWLASRRGLDSAVASFEVLVAMRGIVAAARRHPWLPMATGGIDPRIFEGPPFYAKCFAGLLVASARSARNMAARAPSATRWSHEMVSVIRGPA